MNTTFFAAMWLVLCIGSIHLYAQQTLILDNPELAGISGFRAHWDQIIPVAQDGQRVLKDAVIKDRGQSAVWSPQQPGALAFDAVHRSLLVRFPQAAEQIAQALAQGNVIAKVELVLPYLDEELWPAGSAGADFPSADGYRYRTNWDCDKLYRAQRPNWHAQAHVLRKPWSADAHIGPTYNAAIKGAVYWKRFAAGDITEDRFPNRLGPTEVSSYQPEGRMDVTAVIHDPAYGKTLGERLRVLSDCGFIVNKEQVYDARYFQGAYEWAISTGPRAILIRKPQLAIHFKAGKSEKISLPPAANVRALADQHQAKPLGTPTAVIPSAAEVAQLNQQFMAKPAWMPDWQYQHVRQLMGLDSGGEVKPFYYRVVPPHVINRTREVTLREAKQNHQTADVDYAIYLAWIDWVHGRPPRYWEGHLTAADNIMQWYNFRAAMPGPMQESILRSWNAWLMPEQETAMSDVQRKDFADTSGKLIHPMADDPRVGVDAKGTQAQWGQGDTYYKLTGNWRGNKSYYRSGFTRMMSTANFNSSAASGALLNGQIIGSEHAMADGRAGLMRFPFWMWTYNGGVGQEYIDHYYWAIATAGNKLFADFCLQPEDQMAGWSIIFKTVNDLANGYHPGLKKLLGPASRTYYQHVLGQQDGLYHILHVLSPQGALNDLETGTLPALTPEKDAKGNTPRPLSAWGHDYPPAAVALQSMSGPWAEPWLVHMIDDKPLPWSSLVEKKVVAEGDWVTTYFGANFGLSSIRQTGQRIHVLGHWRRQAQRPSTMRDLGTLDLRLGFNQTRIAEDGAGVISEQGIYRTYQHENRLLMLARPHLEYLRQQKDITSVQCTAALFNYQQPAPTWEIFVDQERVTTLPVTAKLGQIITIRDGVTYLAIRPLPTSDLGRDVEVLLEPGQPQEPAHHGGVVIQPALLVHAYLCKRQSPLNADDLKKLESAQTGFMVEFADASSHESFEKFQQHIRQTQLTSAPSGLTLTQGATTLVANWDSFTVNGQDPYAYAHENKLIQDTSLSQMGRSHLQKHGAVVTRGKRHPELAMMLHSFPAQKIYVATNPLPNYLDFHFSTPQGVKLSADGACSMSSWVVKDSREINLKYQPFTGIYQPKSEAHKATLIFIRGTSGKPFVTLNGKDVAASLKPWKQDGQEGYVLPLDTTLPADDQIKARLEAAQQAFNP